ncbi:MAG: FAD-binding oxidoreductase [Lachnospiraceae bacterium]|nr:FAD-binding oxidoreductase [Lachnospiraceae bacterium]
MALDRAVYKRLQEIVGERWVSEDPVHLETYRCASVQTASHYGPYDNRTPVPQAVVLPSTTEEVQQIVRLCNEYKIGFKASTTFWAAAGYVGDDNSIQLDMRRMNKWEIDPRNQIAVMEPYAIAAQIQAEAMKHGLTCAITGAGCSTSILASTAGWNGGGPSTISMGNNHDNLLGAEWVLANGEIVRLGSLGSGSGWFSGEGPLFSARAILRGAQGMGGDMGVCTRIATKLSPWPGPDHLPTYGDAPAYKADLPDNFRAYTICFPSWDAWARGYTAFYDNEIIYLGHRQFNMFGRDLKAAMIKIITNSEAQLADLNTLLEDPETQRQNADMKIDTQIVIVGMTERDLAWKEAALDEILADVGAHKSEMMLTKEMVDYTLAYLIRMGHKNLNYVYAGSYEGNMAWSSNVFVDAEWMETVVALKKKWEDEHDYFARVGGDSGLGSMTRAGGGGSTGFEFFIHYDGSDLHSVQGTRKYMDYTPIWMKEHGFGQDLGRVNDTARREDGYSYTQEEHNKLFYGTPAAHLMKYQWKMRELMNPNHLGGTYYRTLDPDYRPDAE